MRKIIVLSMITLDGVMQAPGGPGEDRSGEFEYGGWVAPFGDEVYGEIVQEEMRPADYLLGRKTYEIWANYWPKHGDSWPAINSGQKYVFTNTLANTDSLISGWANSQVVNDVPAIRRLKETEGPDIQVWGSSKLIQLLLANDLADELHLKIHPLTLGKGKKLFDNGPFPASYKLTDSVVTPGGVIIARYARAGKVETGTVASPD